jgi:hypothetical protein
MDQRKLGNQGLPFEPAPVAAAAGDRYPDMSPVNI